MPADTHQITPADLLPPDVYARERDARRRALIPIKRNRRIEVGPFVTVYFENFVTMLGQVHEMLHIERGGEAQIAGELDAYNPSRRAATLLKLAGIETCTWMQIGDFRIPGTPTDYADRTTPEGKTSSVHWVRFRFAPAQIESFRNAAENVVLGISHENYGHMAVISADKRAELSKDFD